MLIVKNIDQIDKSISIVKLTLSHSDFLIKPLRSEIAPRANNKEIKYIQIISKLCI